VNIKIDKADYAILVWRLSCAMASMAVIEGNERWHATVAQSGNLTLPATSRTSSPHKAGTHRQPQ